MTIKVSKKGKDLDSCDHVLDFSRSLEFLVLIYVGVTPEATFWDKLVLRNPVRKDCAFDAVWDSLRWDSGDDLWGNFELGLGFGVTSSLPLIWGYLKSTLNLWLRLDLDHHCDGCFSIWSVLKGLEHLQNHTTYLRMGRVELWTPLPCTEKGMQSEAWVSRKAISQSSRLSFHSGNKICGMTVCTMDLQDPILRCFLLLVVRTEGALASPWWPTRWSPDPKTPALQAGNSLCWIETQSIRPCFTSLTSSSPLSSFNEELLVVKGCFK